MDHFVISVKVYYEDIGNVPGHLERINKMTSLQHDLKGFEAIDQKGSTLKNSKRFCNTTLYDNYHSASAIFFGADS